MLAPLAHLAMTRTLRLTLAYDGTDYHGWQVQPALPTVQGLLTDALSRILREPVKVVGASRTDAGVHALGQVASFVTTREISLLAIRSGLNALLPSDVRVLEVAEAPPGFDARRSARLKRYAYLIDNGPVALPLLRRYSWHVPKRLDPTAMRAALRALRGKHDFSAFCAAPGRERTPICTVFSSRLLARRSLLAVFVSADSFLHHMVRNILGSLVEVGRGIHRPEWIAELLSGRDRTRAGPTAPPHGLTLLRVSYSLVRRSPAT
ncbi:MAG: tRNA pseudouridine(38-40) synthase TruA [Candidatus Rokubacteria bacterium]|nr:tRNA pseudouridine(38-40) synthase TruA [Candidatus Rokubacteria bacterium]